MTASQNETIVAADSALRGEGLPSYSELVMVLAVLDQSEVGPVDRIERKRRLAIACRMARLALARFGKQVTP